MHHSDSSSAPQYGFGIILLLAFLVALSALSIDTYLPGLPFIADYFEVSSALVQQSIGSFFIGMAAGQLLAGPLSDRFGRRPILIIGFTLFFIATLGCALAPNIHTLIIARGLQGFAIAASPAAGRAMVRDIWEGNEAARAMSFVTMVMFIAPLIAPSLGGLLLTWWNWQAIFWMLMVVAIIALVLVLWLLPETNGPEKRGDVRLHDYFRAYGKVLRSAQAWAYLLCGGLSLATMFAYITGSPYVYIELFDVPADRFGLFFALNVVGLFIGTWINSRVVIKHGYHRPMAIGVGVTLAGSCLLLVTSWAGIGGLPMIAVGLFIAIAPISMVGGNCTVGLMNLYPHNSGAAVALFGVAQFGLAACASVLVGLFYTGTPVAMAGAMTVMATGSLIAMGALTLRRSIKARALSPHAATPS